MYAFRSVILTAISLFVSTNVDIAIASLYTCSFPDGFLVATENEGKAYLHKSQVIFNVPDDGYSIFKYPKTGSLTFTVSNVDAIFNGYFIYAGPEGNSTQPIQVCHSLKARVSGVTQQYTERLYEGNVQMILDCHVYVLPMVVKRINKVSSDMVNEIYRLAESCLRFTFCSQVSKLQEQYKVGYPNMTGFAQMPNLVYPEYGSRWRVYYHMESFGDVIKSMMQNDSKIFIEHLKATEQTRFNVPDIDTRFTTIRNNITTEGHFEATNGVLSNGTENILSGYTYPLSHEGLKFIIQKEYYFNGLNIDYNYTLKHGDAMAKGHMNTYMDSVKFEATFSVDYTEMPCKTNLVDIKILLFEEVRNVFTDPGSLKPLLETRNWFDKKASDDLAERIVQHLRDGVNSLNPGLEAFPCEKYRL